MNNQEIEFTENSLKFILFPNSNTAKVVYSPNASGDVFINNYVNYDSKQYFITIIDEKAFKNTNITSLSFHKDSHVKRISNFAFQDSTISSLSIPASLEEFGENWCNCVENLNDITVDDRNPHFECVEGVLIQKSPKEIIIAKRNISGNITDFKPDNKQDDKSDNKPKYLILPKDIKKIWPSAFFCCNQIKSFMINSPILESIGSSAFCQCENLSNIKIIGTNQLILGDNCFSFSQALTYATIISNELKIGRGCFQSCNSLSVIDFSMPQKISFGELSFFQCEKIEQLSITPQTFLEIRNQSFSTLPNLKSLFLSTEQYSILDESFQNCPAIESFYFKAQSDINLDFMMESDLLKDITLTSFSTIAITNTSLSRLNQLEKIKLRSSNLILENECFQNHNKLSSIYIETVSPIIIDSDTFRGCPSLISFKLAKFNKQNNSKKATFKENCFSDAKNLKTIEIEADYILIDDNAFSGAINLQEISLKCINMKIKNGCFNNCTSLEKFKILDSRTTSIGKRQFINCSKLKEISITVSQNISASSFLNREHLILDKECFKGANKLETICIKGGNVKLEKDQIDCTSISNILIQNANNVEIGPELFNNCKELVKVEIGSRSLKIKENCFNDNSKLQSVILSSFDIDIQTNCFNNAINCEKLEFTKVDFFYLDSSDFCGWKKLKDLEIKSSSSIIIGQNCFNKLKNIICIIFHSLDITIGFKAFNDCPSLFSVKFIQDANVSHYLINKIAISSAPTTKRIQKIYICDEAFCNCLDLREVVIDSEKELFIGKKCFYNLKELKTVKIISPQQKIDEHSFYNCPDIKNISNESFITDTNVKIDFIDVQKMFTKRMHLNTEPIDLRYKNDRKFNSFYFLGINRSHKPEFIAMFPTIPADLPVEMIESVAVFCYPKDLKPINPKLQTDSNILSGFVFITGDQFHRYIGVVLHIYIPPSLNSFVGNQYDHSYPFSLCLLTNNPDISSHFQFLGNMVPLIVGKVQPPQINNFDIEQYRALLPAPTGQCYKDMSTRPNCEYIALSSSARSLNFLLPELLKYYNFQIQLERSLYHSDFLLYPTLQTLLSYLSPQAIVETFLCTLCEYHIEFISEDKNSLNKVSFCVIAISNILRNHYIQSHTIPFLPDIMIEIFGSPFPYLIGHHKKTSENVCDVFVDLDNGKITYHNKELEQVIQKFSYTSTLTNKLNNFLQKYKSEITIPSNKKQFSQFIQKADKTIYPECFQYFAQTKYILTPHMINEFVNLFTNPFFTELTRFAEGFLITDSTNPHNVKTVLQRDAFIKNIEEKYQNFMNAFTKTMFFDQFQLKLENKMERERSLTEVAHRVQHTQFGTNAEQITSIIKKIPKHRNSFSVTVTKLLPYQKA